MAELSEEVKAAAVKVAGDWALAITHCLKLFPVSIFFARSPLTNLD